jgi:pterin-4a-carbinolamine dehydratase
MSGRFFRGGRALFQSSLQATRGRRNMLTAPVMRSQQLTITFTSPAAMLANALTASSSTPLGSSGQSALGSSSTGGIRSNSTQSSNSGGARGCGNANCCQTAATSLTLGEDGEEPFIGGPSLSLSNKQQSNTQNQQNSPTSAASCSTNNTNTTAAASSNAATTASSAAPPPRVKCDPYEQGGNPLTTPVVREHMQMTLDPAWEYDEEKKMLVRVFEFGRLYSQRADSTERLFSFLNDIGNIQKSNSHPVYNLNINLRANAVQVVLRTIALKGISYQDLMLGTKLDGMWFREGMRKEQREREQRQREKQLLAKQQQQQQQPSSTNSSSSSRPNQPSV